MVLADTWAFCASSHPDPSGPSYLLCLNREMYRRDDAFVQREPHGSLRAVDVPSMGPNSPALAKPSRRTSTENTVPSPLGGDRHEKDRHPDSRLVDRCGLPSNDQLARNALPHDKAICAARGYDPVGEEYLRCCENLGAKWGIIWPRPLMAIWLSSCRPLRDPRFLTHWEPSPPVPPQCPADTGNSYSTGRWPRCDGVSRETPDPA